MQKKKRNRTERKRIASREWLSFAKMAKLFCKRWNSFNARNQAEKKTAYKMPKRQGYRPEPRWRNGKLKNFSPESSELEIFF